MENDSEQLYFNFDEYDDSENPANNEYFATREELNYNAVQAIQKSEQILDRFENLELLNAYSFQDKIKKLEGHSSFVFSATDSVDDKKVVLKCLDPLFSSGTQGLSDIDTDIDYERLFIWEDKILTFLLKNRHTVNKTQNLSRANVNIQTKDGTFIHKVSYIALEKLKIELKKAFVENKTQSLKKTAEHLRLFCQILNAVLSIHKEGVFHLDLKPSNLMAKSGKQKDGVVLIDFASSSAKEDVCSKIREYPQKWHGTEDYASPEILCGLSPEEELATAQDMYSLGCMLFELCAYKNFSQKLHEQNPGYITAIENCRIYQNDGETLQKRLLVFNRYLDTFASSMRPVTLGEEANLPLFVKKELDAIIQKFTSFDWRKRPKDSSLPEIRDRLYSLAKILYNTHLLEIAKKRREIHRRKLLKLTSEAK